MESKYAASEESSTQTERWPTVSIRKEMHTLIGTVREIELVTTLDQVFEGMKDYILKNKLFDPVKPHRVCCKDDQLGVVLGVEEFTISQVKTLVKKVITPIQNIRNCPAEATSSLQSDNLNKRKADENTEPEQRKVFVTEVSNHASPMKLYIPPTPESGCNESDTADSIQGYETALAKDTSDTSISSDGAYHYEEDIFDIEYEVESVSSNSDHSDSSFSASDVNSGSEVMLSEAIVAFLSKTDSDKEFFADGSSDDEDEEISEIDHWKCNRCHSLNRPPMRYCARCWEQRLEWLPDKSSDRPLPPRRQKMKKAHNKEVGQLVNNSSAVSEASISQCDQDSQSLSSPGVSSQLSRTSSSQSSTNAYTSDNLPSFKMCMMCCTKPANASIIHAKYAHQVACYRCARKLQKQKQRCPICRRAIERVVYQIS